MKRIQIMVVASLMFLGARAASADTLTSADNGKTVVDVVTTPTYGTTTIKWLADANFAASLDEDSPYWVPGINPDGSMPLSVAFAFINKLNEHAYLGITTWRLPITITHDDLSCSFTSTSGGDSFGYTCGEPFDGQGNQNTAYPYSELAGLFYNGLGGQAHNNIALVHNSAYHLFKHLQPYLYWSSTAQSNNTRFSNDFWFQNGFEGTEDEYDSMFVLPVSTVTTGTPPTTTPACATVLPPSCNEPLLPGLGLNTTVPPAHPTLEPSFDGELIYDRELNVTFLANANLAATLSPSSPYYVSGINPDGSMNSKTLAKFLAALNDPAHPYLGLTGWTVPRVAEYGQDSNCTLSSVGPGNFGGGYNCDGKANQLGELFYDELGGVAGHDIAWPSNWYAWFFTHVVFTHLESNYYWQCHPAGNDLLGSCEPGTGGGEPSFSFLSGYQGSQTDVNDLFVLLEVPGDAIPHTKRW